MVTIPAVIAANPEACEAFMGAARRWHAPGMRPLFVIGRLPVDPETAGGKQP
ncbi:hypothetical protein JYK14_14070 [Siccirubricoccus sp. KC 17139]|uniref:Uncharacterized protein n=1 Tax=Siccirubricoccus soli TaxID=2899147 RepID=A0ABT1D5S8_9PROT|nr:hypothetical protein [Siccirubricoccus soli]MCO6417283.1 hypothetical protein [Siccirubricoccus soli]MCP2683418.1 hypothetical protein [Siccirubricoccus soli]